MNLSSREDSSPPARDFDQRSRRENSTYAASGVSISEGEQFVEKLKPLVKSTFTRQVLTGIGNFGAFFQIPKGYKKPVFVASTDGLGTKLKVAEGMNKFDTIGEDLVNHWRSK
jgi:phosphoribosylformylglycinamidine cyclo-ligase